MSLRKASTSLVSRSSVGFTGGGGGAAVTISNVIVTDSSWNNLDDTAVGTSSSYIKIIGSGFVVNPSVYVGTTQISSGSITFVSSTELRVVLPSLSLGTQNLFVFNTDYSGAIWSAGLVVSGFPDYTQTTYTSTTPLSVSVQLLATGDAPLTYALQGGSSLPAGTSLSSSGLITGTTTDGTYQFTVIVTDAQNQSFQQQLTLTITSTDEYFNRTTLAINGDVNTFVTDASSNNLPITVAGDTKPSAFGPYNTNWSVYIDGTDYLEVTQNASLAFQGGGAWTWESFVYPITGGVVYASYTGPSNSGASFIFSVGTSIGFSWILNGTDTWSFDSGSTGSTANSVQLNTWSHCAVSYDGAGSLKFFVNGTLNATFSRTVNVDTLVYNIRVGRSMHPNFPSQFGGYLSNMRFIKGTALYTSSFTAPTSALTAVANTVFLGFTSNRMTYDASSVNNTITPFNTPQTTSFGPFTETDTTTGSGYFDGTGDNLLIPSNSALDLPADFTIECWVNFSALGTNRIILDRWSSGVNGGWQLYWRGTGTSITFFFNTAVVAQDPSATRIQTNSWYHIAAVRSGTTCSLYINGEFVASGTLSLPLSPANIPLCIGEQYSTLTNDFSGHISNVRIVRSALYTSNFIPPTTPLTAIANTQVLTLQNRQPVNNHTFIDTSGNNFLITRNGNASQGSFSPFSPAGWSNYFDGSGDILTLSGTSATNFNGVDWTFECWFYKTALSGGNDSIIQSTTGTNNWIPYFGLGLNNNFTIAASINAAAYNSSQTYSLNTWNHIAMVRSGGVVKVYLNGAATSISVTSDIISTNLTFWFGKTDNVPGGGNYIYHYNGYLSNLRLVKGTAVYTSNFTPPTAPLTAITNTSLLTCQSNRFIDNSTNNFTITRTGDTKVVNFSPFKPTAAYSPATHGGSAYFDGSGDYISIPSGVTTYTSGGSTATNKDFTIEGFFYLNVLADSILFARWPSYNTRGLSFSVGSTGTINFLCANVAASWLVNIVSSAGVVKTGEWNHFAATRAGNTYRLFLNGALIGSSSPTAFVISDETTNITIGGSLVSGYTLSFNGYISNVRFNTTQALYTTAFTPPTSILPNSSNTVLSLPFNNAAIVDVSSRNVMETVGDAKIVSSIRKYGTGSMYFDGTGDYLTSSATPNLNMGTDDWTVEGWVYVVTRNSNYPLIIGNNNGGFTAGALALTVSNTDNASYNDRFVLAAYDLGGTRLLVADTTNNFNTWYHFAVVRNGTNLIIYRNGISLATTTISAAFTFDWGKLGLRIGGGNWDGINGTYNGYIDDLRITRFARYTANFTPPTSTLLAQ